VRLTLTLTLTLTCIAALLLCACPQQEPTGGDAPAIESKPAHEPLAFDTDYILDSLNSEEADIRNFALLAIVNFKLKGYREPVLELAGDDPVAAVAAAAVYGEISPMSEFFITAPPVVRVETLLGVVFGLRCADAIPAAAWVDIISRVPEAEFEPLLWGIAQLDVEPGGPIKRSDELIAAWENRYVEAREAGSIYRQGALDALLGGDSAHEIDWAAYTAHVPEANWNSVQWRALLRWADAETWDKVVKTRGVNDRIRYQLAKAVALSGPEGVLLPGGIGPWAGIDADIEYRVNQYTGGAADTIEMPELKVLLHDIEAMGNDGDADSSAGINQRVLSDVLAVFDYSIAHGVSANITQVVDAMAQMPAEVRTAVMATAMRRNPAAIDGSDLDKLIALDDRDVAYFLLDGWYADEQVQQSLVPKTVRMFAGSGNIIVAFAYQQWFDDETNGRDT